MLGSSLSVINPVDIPATANDDHYRANPSYETYVGQAINGTSILTNDLNKNLIKDSNLLTGTISVEDRIVIVEDENTIKNVDGSYNLYKGGKDGTFLGNLKVNEDGTFTFQPKEGITGEVAFKYHIQTEITRLQNKSSVYSNDATVTLLIKESPKTEISGQKTWTDNDNQDGIRPTEIEVELLKNNQETGNTVILNADNNWKGTFDNLPVHENGEKITYTVKEITVSGYAVNITQNGENNFTITNTHTPGVTSVTVNKVWDDKDDQDGLRPDSIEVELLKNGEPTGNILTLNEENHWTGTFNNLPIKENGVEIEYTVFIIKN